MKNNQKIKYSIDYILIVTIIISILALILGTVESISVKYGVAIKRIELVAVVIFTVEYIVRVLVVNLSEKRHSGIKGRILFMLTPLMLIDLLAILPFYLTFLGGEMVILRLFRILYLLRILKISRYSTAITTVKTALIRRTPELLVALLVMLILILVSASLLYFTEHESQPEVFSSIPASIWTAVACLSPLGFDGAAPVTSFGRVIAILLGIFGVALIGLPAGILSAEFRMAMKKDKEES
ncbi:MAG: ion transporter [Deltaproteobacteria bacterium]|nr:ion transporter [Deltaproteobacteria bacterium]